MKLEAEKTILFEAWTVLFQIFRLAMPLAIFLTNFKMNVLNFFILPKTICEKFFFDTAEIIKYKKIP